MQRRRGPAQLELQQIGEQVVVAEPRPPDVERGDERVRVLEALQDRLRARAAGQRVGERAADPLEDGRCAGAGRAPPAAGAPAPPPAGSPRRCARCRRTRRRSAPGRGVRRARSRPAAGRPPTLRSARGAAPGPRRTARPRSRPAARASPPARSAGRGARISVSAPASRSRCSPSAGSSRVASTTRSSGGSSGQEAARADCSASAERSSCRSSITSTTGCSSECRSDSSRSTTASPPNAGVARDPLHQRVRPTASASSSMTESQKRCASRSPRSTETQATRSASPRGLHPGAQQHGLAAPRGRAHEDDLARAGAPTAGRTAAARHQPAPSRRIV